MVRQNFFNSLEVVTADRNIECLNWEIPKDLPYFDGHFPGLPVLPAVAIVDISLCLLKNGIMSPTVRLQGVTSAKFMHPLGPGQRVDVIASQQGADWDVKWLDAKTKQVTSQLTLSLAD